MGNDFDNEMPALPRDGILRPERVLQLLSAGQRHSQGLNHISTADTVPDRTVAVQASDTFGSGSQDYWTGFETGLAFRPFKGDVVESQYAPNEPPSVGKILTHSRFDSHIL